LLKPFYIALLELKRYMVDRGDLAFSIALPIVLFALMYSVFQGETSFRGAAHIVDQDGGRYATDLIARLERIDQIEVKRYSLKKADNALDRSAILTAIVIPAGFSAGLDSGVPVGLVFKQRGFGGDEGQIVASIVQGVAQQLVGELEVHQSVTQALEGTSVTPDQISTHLASAFAQVREQPLVTVDTTVIGGDDDVINRLLPGIITMFLLFAVTLGAQTLVEERRIGTLERLLTTRLSVNQLFIGKFLAGASRATLQAVILISLAFAALQVAGVSEYFEVMAFALLVAASVSAVGLVIGAVSRTRDQAVWTAVFFTMFMTIFGGTFFELSEGSAMELVSKFTLNRYAIRGMENILNGDHIWLQSLELGVLAGVAVAGLVAARLAFKASEGGR
jgi:ABC-2 type transport system permease protein